MKAQYLGHVVFYVRDLERAGVTINGMSDHTVSQSLYLLDPDGNEVELYVDADPSIWQKNPAAVLSLIKPLRLRRIDHYTGNMPNPLTRWGLILTSFLLSLTLWSCKVKIAGDDYLIGPFPTSEQQDEDRGRDLQEPAPDKAESNQENR